MQPDLPQFRISLAETTMWCIGQPVSSESHENADETRRRGLIEKVNKMFRRVREKHGADAYNTPEWLQATQLATEANPDSLAPLAHQLRTQDLKPELAL